MTAKERVLEKWPDAFCGWGATRYEVLAESYCNKRSCLGWGSTVDAAWDDAANKLPAEDAGETKTWHCCGTTIAVGAKCRRCGTSYQVQPSPAPPVDAARPELPPVTAKLCTNCGEYEHDCFCCRCMDCDRLYPHGLDFVLTWKQWTAINPDDGGVLCPSCMVNRAAKLPHVLSVYGCIMFAENIEPNATDTLESMIAALRMENSDYCREKREMQHNLQDAERENEGLREQNTELMKTINSLAGGAAQGLLAHSKRMKGN